MFENKSNATPIVQSMILHKLTSWEGKSVKNEKEAFQYFYSDTEYLLRMLWQGRLDKMSIDNKVLNVWISENYVPKEFGFDKNKIREGQLIGLELSHEDLATLVLKEVWKDYLTSDIANITKPPQEKVGFLKRIFK